MSEGRCDEAPLKDRLKQQLHSIKAQIQRHIDVIDNENICLLSEFERIGQQFNQVESMAASFYLQCYLSSFTNQFQDLAISIKHLMDKRHGALIVIQRENPLDAWIRAGTKIGASLSHTLLESIFYPGNPLHDGAVVIASDRIDSAGNVLPLSGSPDLDAQFGTRHRAALGLSERTDALALVVSEERGTASFAYKGKLHPLTDIRF